MAARLWRWLLGCELAIAAAVAASLAVAWQLSAAEALFNGGYDPFDTLNAKVQSANG